MVLDHRVAIMRLWKILLAEAMLSSQIRNGDTAIVDVSDDGEVRVEVQKSCCSLQVAKI